MIVQELIKSAYKVLGIVADGEDLTENEYKDGLEAFEDLLSSLSLEGLTLLKTETKKIGKPYEVKPSDPSFDPNTTGKKWKDLIVIGGSNSDYINEDAIMNIRKVYFSDGITHYNCTETSISNIKDLKVQGIGTPKYFAKTYGENSLILEFDITPQENLELYIVGSMPFNTDLKLEDEIEVSFGYKKMLKLNLAREIALLFGLPISDNLLSLAIESKDKVKAQRQKELVLKTDYTLKSVSYLKR